MILNSIVYHIISYASTQAPGVLPADGVPLHDGPDGPHSAPACPTARSLDRPAGMS